MVFGDAISAEASQKGLAIDFLLALKQCKGQQPRCKICKMVTASDCFNLLGELLIRFEARQDLGNPVYLNATLASSCERKNLKKSGFGSFNT